MLFERRHSLDILKDLFSCCHSLVAFTGSILQSYHNDYIIKQFDGKTLNFIPNGKFNMEAICHGVTLFQTKLDHSRALVEICLKQTCNSPVVLILNEGFEAVGKALIRSGIAVEALALQSTAESDSVLSQFCSLQKDRYAVFIVNQNQGRGLDFPTNIEIEKKGGVYVLIATLPSFYLQYRQFIGRTGRTGSKGQFGVCLCEKLSKNFEGELFLQKKLEELKNNDLLYLSVNHSICELPLLQLKPQQEVEEIKCSGAIPFTAINDEANHNLDVPKRDRTLSLCTSYSRNSDVERESTMTRMNNASWHAKELQQLLPSVPLKKRETKRLWKEDSQNSLRHRSRNPIVIAVDQGYFESYSDPKIHVEMLADVVRMDVYSRAIIAVSKGKLVVDVGAGTGALSIIAAKAGATRVYAIEFSEMASTASITVKDNQVDHIVEVINSLAEDTNPPFGKVDVVVSEWMGYFLLCENMLSSVTAVRDTWLKEDGIMVPRRASMSVAAFEAKRKQGGLDFTSLSTVWSPSARIEVCEQGSVVSSTSIVLDLDLRRDSLKTNSFTQEFSVKLTRDANVAGLVGWFDTEMTDGIELSTSPFSAPTHWQQTMFYFKGVTVMKAEEQLSGTISVRPQAQNHRALEVILIVSFPNDPRQKQMTYTLG